jgi:hypothetical protein
LPTILVNIPQTHQRVILNRIVDYNREDYTKKKTEVKEKGGVNIFVKSETRTNYTGSKFVLHIADVCSFNRQALNHFLLGQGASLQTIVPERTDSTNPRWFVVIKVKQVVNLQTLKTEILNRFKFLKGEN